MPDIEFASKLAERQISHTYPEIKKEKKKRKMIHISEFADCPIMTEAYWNEIQKQRKK